MNIFLTGATGFVGAQLINALLRNKEYHLYILYRDEARKNKLITASNKDRLHFVKGDITTPLCGLDAATIASLPSMDYFYHLAALVKFDEALHDDLFSINYDGTLHALDLAKNLNTNHFLYVSTAYTVGTHEYAKEALHPLDTPVNNPYEASKIKAEHAVVNSGLTYSILRPAIIIGDSITGEADSKFTLYGFMKALKVFKRKMERKGLLDKQSFRLFADNNCTSNLVPVDYVVKVLTHAIPHAEHETIYHITNNQPPENLKVLEMIKRHLQFDALTVAPTSARSTMNAEEAVLNGFIHVFEPYFKKSIVFEENNTKALLSKVNESTLQVTDDNLDYIIEVFFK
ncbi:SDR family oxidoreductase [Macrococcus armenti]|uniref:SDR family oxidoreductase n=1 Tax=Macrococcus armenti TaxID=2875764 RepID=UPI001CC96410|nr:SDR family oxidoreductase [Macrococcus armenti]UBH15525.1 SDR family oxidoreductase [Macrococcus armenti]UBH17885.1 SDR family oxidoreductase [Macrococcus armenti]UBH20151.1 SDR family oxidoreductase [Macrococcus armenti]